MSTRRGSGGRRGARLMMADVLGRDQIVGHSVTEEKSVEVKELSSTLKAELATIAGQGGASIFWMTDTQARAERLTKAERDGLIVRHRDDPKDAYPWCVFSVTELSGA